MASNLPVRTDPGMQIDGVGFKRAASCQVENGGARNGANSGTDSCPMSQKEPSDVDPTSVQHGREPESAYLTLLDDVSVDVQRLPPRGRKERRFKRLKRGELELVGEGEGLSKEGGLKLVNEKKSMIGGTDDQSCDQSKSPDDAKRMDVAQGGSTEQMGDESRIQEKQAEAQQRMEKQEPMHASDPKCHFQLESEGEKVIDGEFEKNESAGHPPDNGKDGTGHSGGDTSGSADRMGMKKKTSGMKRTKGIPVERSEGGEGMVEETKKEKEKKKKKKEGKAVK